MARSENNLTAVLQDTADAIKSKTGSSAKISPRDFANKISDIPTASGTKYLQPDDLNILFDGSSQYDQRGINVKNYEYVKFEQRHIVFMDELFSEDDFKWLYDSGSINPLASGCDCYDVSYRTEELGGGLPDLYLSFKVQFPSGYSVRVIHSSNDSYRLEWLSQGGGNIRIDGTGYYSEYDCNVAFPFACRKYDDVYVDNITYLNKVEIKLYPPEDGSLTFEECVERFFNINKGLRIIYNDALGESLKDETIHDWCEIIPPASGSGSGY